MKMVFFFAMLAICIATSSTRFTKGRSLGLLRGNSDIKGGMISVGGLEKTFKNLRKIALSLTVES